MNELNACDESAALAAADKGLAMCMEDEYADQETGPEAYGRLKQAITRKI